jgi:hypothetical protein
VAGSFRHGNGPSGSIKVWGFLDKLNDDQLLKRTLLHGVGLESIVKKICGMETLCHGTACTAGGLTSRC